MEYAICSQFFEHCMDLHFQQLMVPSKLQMLVSTLLVGRNFFSHGHNLTSELCICAQMQVLDNVPWPKSPYYLRKKCFSGFQLAYKLQFVSWWKFSFDLVMLKLNLGSWPLFNVFCHVFCSAQGRVVSPSGV